MSHGSWDSTSPNSIPSKNQKKTSRNMKVLPGIQVSILIFTCIKFMENVHVILPLKCVYYKDVQ